MQIRANNIFSVVAFLLACLIIVSSGFYVLDLVSDRGRIISGNCENQSVSTASPIDSTLGSEMEETTQLLENPPSNRKVPSSGELYWKTLPGSGTTKATWSRISEDSSGRWRMKSGTTAEGVEPPKSTTTRSWWYIGSDEDYLNVDDEDNYINSGNDKLSTATTMKPATRKKYNFTRPCRALDKGPSIKYVTLFWWFLTPSPSPCHKLSQILAPLPLKVCHTSEQKVNKQISEKWKLPLNNYNYYYILNNNKRSYWVFPINPEIPLHV